MTDHTMKDEKSQYPGKMAVAETRGTYSGCRVKTFTASSTEALDDAINSFFAENDGLLVVDIKFTSVEVTGNSGMRFPEYVILLTYTAQVDEEYLQVLQERGAEIDRILAERKAERMEAEEKANEAKEEARKKVADLAEKGRLCVNNHAALLKDMDALKAEVKKLRKGKS